MKPSKWNHSSEYHFFSKRNLEGITCQIFIPGEKHAGFNWFLQNLLSRWKGYVSEKLPCWLFTRMCARTHTETHHCPETSQPDSLARRLTKCESSVFQTPSLRIIETPVATPLTISPTHPSSDLCTLTSVTKLKSKTLLLKLFSGF